MTRLVLYLRRNETRIVVGCCCCCWCCCLWEKNSIVSEHTHTENKTQERKKNFLAHFADEEVVRSRTQRGEIRQKPQYPVAQQECYSFSPKNSVFRRILIQLFGVFFSLSSISGGDCAKWSTKHAQCPSFLLFRVSVWFWLANSNPLRICENEKKRLGKIFKRRRGLVVGSKQENETTRTLFFFRMVQ